MMIQSPGVKELGKFNDMIGLKRLAKADYEKYMDDDNHNCRAAACCMQKHGVLKDEKGSCPFQC